jgi:hypothetical protein
MFDLKELSDINSNGPQPWNRLYKCVCDVYLWDGQTQGDAP